MTDNGEGLRIEVLGPIRAWRGAKELELGPARQRAIFAALAIRAGHTVTGGELVSAVWGPQAPASALGSVHTYVSGLRRALEPEREQGVASALLTTGSAGYTLHVDPLRVDVLEFERSLADIRGHRETIAPRELVASLDKALALWLGEPLPGLAGQSPQQERARLAELRVTALELRAEVVLELGEHQDLVAELTGLSREHPLRERFRELLMLAHYRSGQHAEALAVFRDARATLAAELGVEPGAPLRKLHARILTGDPTLEAAPRDRTRSYAAPAKQERHVVLPAPVTGRIESGVRPTFVGRQTELNRLRALVDDVCERRGSSVLIEGDFGIGKSELLVNALFDIRSRSCQIGWTIADELSVHSPCQVIFSCLGAGETLRYSRSPAALTGVYGEPGTEAERDLVPSVAGEAFSLVDELCARAPLILVIDDIQWADESSVLLWQRLTLATRKLPLLLIAVARPVPRSAELARLRQMIEDEGGAVIPIGPLSADEALQLHETLIGVRAGPELRDLVERTTGNPLYITELTEGLVREQALVTGAGFTELRDSATYTAPRGLVDTIRRHLDLLSGDTRETLRWAALLGTEFTVADVVAVTGKQPTQLLAAFQEAVAARIVVDGGSHLAFRQPLFRLAFYDGIPVGARISLHRQAAETLASAGASVSRVAEQIAATREMDAWVVEWLTDNHTSVSERAPLIAVDLLARALDGCATTDSRREVIVAALARLRFRLDQPPEDEARLAMEIATDPAVAAEMRQLLAQALFRSGEVQGAAAILTEAVDDPAVPEVWRQRHRRQLADFRRGDLEAADATGLRASDR